MQHDDCVDYPLLKKILDLKLRKNPANENKSGKTKDIDASIIQRINELVIKYKVAMTQMIVVWVPSKPLFVCPIIGYT